MVNLYLLLGKENHLKKEFIQSLKKKFFPTGDSSLNYQEFNIDKERLSSVVDFIQTAPFLSEQRVAVLWGLDELEDDEQSALLAVKKRWPSTGVLIACSDAANLKKSDFLSNLGKDAHVTIFHVPFDRDMPQWLANRASKKGIPLDGQAIMLLLERVGKDIAALDSSLESLALFIHPRKQITGKDVESLLGRSVQEDVFALMDDLLDKNSYAALKRTEDLFRDGVKSFELVSILSGQLDRMNKVMSGAEDLKIHPYVMEKLEKQCRKLTKEKLVWMIRQVLSCDEAIKTSQIEDRVCLEGLILSICESNLPAGRQGAPLFRPPLVY